jgi:Ca-activated chloride channel homolog
MFLSINLARTLALLLALAALCGGPLALTRAQQQQPPAQQSPRQGDAQQIDDDEVLTVDTSLTNVLFSATDRDKRFYSNLSKEDIRVAEDGVPQEIFTFQKQVDLPITLAIVIDTSASQEYTLPQEKSAARAFVDSVLRPAKDEVAVVSFTGDVTLEQGLTGNVSRVRSAIDKVEFVPPSGYIGGGVVVGTPPISGSSRAGSTALWDAVYVTCDEVLSESSERTRRAIVLLTDGVDTSSRVKLEEAVERAIKNETLVFAIGIGDRFNYRGVDEGSLKKITERTGGRAYFPRGEEDLRAAFAQIQRELREQYLVAYSPTNKRRDGSFRRLQIEIANPELKRQNLKLTYRQGYFAKSDEPPAQRRRRS